jgi:hypothetical protein
LVLLGPYSGNRWYLTVYGKEIEVSVKLEETLHAAELFAERKKSTGHNYRIVHLSISRKMEGPSPIAYKFNYAVAYWNKKSKTRGL